MITPVKQSKKSKGENGWILHYIKQYRGALIGAIALSVLAYVFASALMFTSGYMVSLAAAVPLTVLALHVPSLFVRIFGIGKPFIRYAERLVSHNWVLRMTSHMRVRLYDALAARTSALCSKERLGSLLDLLTDDIGHAQDLFLRGILPLASSGIVALLVVVAAGAFSWQLCMLMILLLAVVVVLLPIMSAVVNGARMASVKEQKTALYQEASDDIYGMADWLLAGRSQDYVKRVMNSARIQNAVDEQIRRYSRRSDLASQVVFCIAIIGLLVWASVVFAGSGAGDGVSGVAALVATVGNENAPAYAPNWIAAFVICFFPLIEAFMPTSHAALSLDSQWKALKRLDRFSLTDEATRGDAAVGEDVAAGETTTTAEDSATVQAASLGTFPKTSVGEQGDVASSSFDIAFDRASFAYDASQAQLVNDFTLAIPQGMKLALLGRSGVGKTTVASLLHGDIAPVSGAVRIDGINASDLVDAMPSLVGIIRQDPFLFNLTLRDNLRLANPSAPDSILIETLEKVGLGDRFSALPKGLDTIIDMNGSNFSGGEKQRIALARILLADQPIVILDEPFVGIDRETERLLITTMLNELVDKTVFVITHHLQNIELFDKVVFMERSHNSSESSIAFEGSPQELAETNELFRKLMRMDR